MAAANCRRDRSLQQPRHESRHILEDLPEALMPQFAVYRNKNLRNRALFPLLVDVQSDLLQDLETRLVIPLSNAFALQDFPLAYLTPQVTLDGERYLLMTPQLAGVARGDLAPTSAACLATSLRYRERSNSWSADSEHRVRHAGRGCQDRRVTRALRWPACVRRESRSATACRVARTAPAHSRWRDSS